MKIGDLVKYGPYFGVVIDFVGDRYDGFCSNYLMVRFEQFDTTEMLHPKNLRRVS